MNAATRHIIWCAALAAVAWLGWASSPYQRSASDRLPVGHRGADPIYIPFSARRLFVIIFVGIWAAIALVNLLRLLPGLRAVYALRDRCRPFPPAVEVAASALARSEDMRGRRTELKICDAVPGATVLGFQRPCIAHSFGARRGADSRRARSGDSSRACARAAARRLGDGSPRPCCCRCCGSIRPRCICRAAVNREREMACDEWVVARTGLPKAYARCLAHAAEVRARMRVGPTLVPRSWAPGTI